MAEAPADLSAYDLIFAGYWVDRGTANAEAAKHPDEADLQRAFDFAADILHWFEGGGQ